MKGDDRLTLLHRVAFTPLAVLTAIYGPWLVLVPGGTKDFWAWQIKPDMSTVWVGAGYTFGACAITTMLVVGRWRGAIVPIISTFPFSVLIMAATLLHPDRFFVGTLRYDVWFVIYAALPVVLPIIWFVN